MKNKSRQHCTSHFELFVKRNRPEPYFCIAILLLTGCTATQVRWDATRIRKEVMVYYNDQIMENLIKAKEQLPFVHTDITLLTSQGGSQITGIIGGGATSTNTNASKSTASAFGVITNTVTRPFAWSVSPQRTETLTITTAPALGSQALGPPSPYPPELTATKETTTIKENPPKDKDSNGEKSTAVGRTTDITTERTLEAKPRKTIYELYEKFAARHLSDDPSEPKNGTYVPGTLKRWEGRYYYIKQAERRDYYEFCKKLFLKGQAGSLEKALSETQAASFAQPAR